MSSGSGFCPKCGSPLTAGSGFCSKCGTPVTLPSVSTFASPVSVPAAPPRKSRKWVWAVVGVVVVVVVLFVLYVLVSGVSPGLNGSTVTVTAINVTSSDNACGVNGHTFTGFTVSGGGRDSETFTITNSGLFFSCTINSVSATTSGFSISGANTPLTIPAGGTESLSFAITAPSGSYNGVLTIDME